MIYDMTISNDLLFAQSDDFNVLQVEMHDNALKNSKILLLKLYFLYFCSKARGLSEIGKEMWSEFFLSAPLDHPEVQIRKVSRGSTLGAVLRPGNP